jgi:DNA topoisomerase-1
MAKNLVIVESPAKAKTIAGFLGDDFIVKSCYGHIRDLAKGNDAVDVKNNFQPVYEVAEEKKALVSELKKLANSADTTWLASDEDREGEAISWHLSEVLNLKEANTRRIVFHEITKNAIDHAIKNPRKIDKHLVDAQQARRILDRLVGFELSPVLWKKVKPSLSAGRVQSVAVRLIVEREREINDFTSSFQYKLVAEFEKTDTPGKIVRAELPKKFNSSEQAEAFLKKCMGATYKVTNLETKPAKRSPAPPFTTSTLQQEASRKLGMQVARTMSIAQKLYEAGHITYMRTDSVNLSTQALEAAEKEIVGQYGKEFAHARTFTTKSAGAQEAHEAIRPTYFNKHTVDMDPSESRLYELIWKRAIASQMADARFEKTTATIGISTTDENLIATGEVLKFEGFLKVYIESTDEDTDDEKSDRLPPMNVGEELLLKEMAATQRFARPAPRYTEASLVKKLEELGIGRPSTYAPTISTIQKRGYVVREDREGKVREYEQIVLKSGKISKEVKTENTGAEKSKLFPSDIGMLVTDFLNKHFTQIMDYNFTATVEKEFDEIALGQLKWEKMLTAFYTPFHKMVDETLETAVRVTGERLLGKDPASGKNVYARIGRFGPIVQIGETNPDSEEKLQYSSLRQGQSIETLTLSEAMDLFKLPRIVGEFEGKDVKVSVGRFGPYAVHESKFYSLAKTDDPYTIDIERASEIIVAKRKAEAEKLIKSFPGNEEVTVLNGRWGPYISVGKQNVKIPKGKNPADLTLEECLALAKEDEGKPKKGGFRRGAAPKIAASETKTIKKAKPAAKSKTAAKPKAASKAKTTAKPKAAKKK